MPIFIGKDGHEINVSGEEEVARFKAAGYSQAAPKLSEKAPVKKSAAKPSEK